MSDAAELTTEAVIEPVVEAPAKPSRKKAAKVVADAPRDWKDLVPQIREMKDAGATVPEIAEALQLSYVLVNQVMLQSYKMTVQTVQVFEAQERLRLGIEA